MKSFMVIREPRAYKLLADETRRKILYLLRVKEMTVSQLATELGITSQAIYHHIKKLLKGNMVEVTREERIGHLIESYYRATAEDFLLMSGRIGSHSLRDRKVAAEQVTTVLNTLKKWGFDLEFDENKISKLVDLRVELAECGLALHGKEFEDKIWNTDDLDLPMKTMAGDFIKTLLLSDKEYAEMQEIKKKFRILLLSLVKKKQ